MQTLRQHACASVAIALACSLTACTTAQARIKRSTHALQTFVSQQACPGTGQNKLPCPGYQIDHKIPLKCHGPDTPANMQWLTIAAHAAKTKREFAWCLRPR